MNPHDPIEMQGHLSDHGRVLALRKRITRLEALNRARNVRADRKLQAELDSTKLALADISVRQP